VDGKEMTKADWKAMLFLQQDEPYCG